MFAAVAFVSFLLVSSVASWEAEDNIDDHLWRHQLKKTYCEGIQSHRSYKTENLAIHCAGKVAVFDDRVSVKCNFQ